VDSPQGVRETRIYLRPKRGGSREPLPVDARAVRCTGTRTSTQGSMNLRSGAIEEG
jgi:hypothetical protein